MHKLGTKGKTLTMERSSKESSLLSLPEVVGAPSGVNAGGDSLRTVDDRTLCGAPIGKPEELTTSSETGGSEANPFTKSIKVMRSPTEEVTSESRRKHPAGSKKVTFEEDGLLTRIREFVPSSDEEADKQSAATGRKDVGNGETHHATSWLSMIEEEVVTVSTEDSLENSEKAETATNDSRKVSIGKGKYSSDPRRILKEDRKRAQFYLKKHEDALAEKRPMQEQDLRHYKWAVDFMKANTVNHHVALKTDKIRRRDSRDGDYREQSDRRRANRERDRDRSRNALGRSPDKRRESTPVRGSTSDRERASSSSAKKSSSSTSSSSSARKATTSRRNSHHRSSAKTPPLNNTPLNELLKRELTVCFVDLNQPDMRISNENYETLEGELFCALSDWISDHPGSQVPVFQTEDRFRGYRVTTCDSQPSLAFLKEAVVKMESPWENAKLDVVSLKDLPAQPKAYIPILLGAKDCKLDERFGQNSLTIIQSRNPDIDMKEWRVLNIGRKFNRRVIITVAIDKPSFEILRRKKYRIKLLNKTLQIRVSARGALLADEQDEEEKIIRELENASLEEIPPVSEDMES